MLFGVSGLILLLLLLTLRATVLLLMIISPKATICIVNLLLYVYNSIHITPRLTFSIINFTMAPLTTCLSASGWRAAPSVPT